MLLSVNTMPNNTKSKGKVGVHFGALRRDISLPRYRFLETGVEKNTNFQLSENDGIQKLWILDRLVEFYRKTRTLQNSKRRA